jgi:tetratricopeptide (TPR) repeat protein
VLENRTGDEALDPLGRQTAARITEAVHRHGVAEVVAADRPTAAAEEDEGLEGPKAVAAFARGNSAGIVIHGSYYVVGDSLQFQLQITDPSKGELMSALRPVMAPRDRPGVAMVPMEERTLGALAAALDFRDGDLEFPTQPPSLAAYRLYWQGSDARWRFEMEEALGFFRQAGAMDSTWISPLLYESITLGNMARYAEEDSVLQVAAGLREHMSELDHLMFQAMLAVNAGGDMAVGLQSARKLATLAPAVGLRWGYWIALYAHRPQEGLELLARVDTTSPRFKRLLAEYWRLSSDMHHLLGNFEEQLEVARDGRRRFPDHMHLLNGQLTALAALGRASETEAFLDTVLALPATYLGRSWVVPHLRALNAAAELRAHGYDDASRTVALHGYDWLESRPLEWKQEHPDWYQTSKAAFLYELGRWEEARDLYEKLAQAADWDPVLMEAVDQLASLAGAAARLGDVERTRAIRAEFEERSEEALSVGSEGEASRLLLGQARIAAVLGEREEAVRLLSEGFRVSPNKGIYVKIAHQLRDFESLRNYLPYQQLLKPRG